MRVLALTFSFYKRFLWISLLLNLILLSMSFAIPVILFVKIFFGILLWAWYKTEAKNHLIFYKNLKINTTVLLSTCLAFDLLIFFLTSVTFMTLL